MAIILPEKANIERFIASNLQKHFDPKDCNLAKRTRVTADLEKWKPEMVDIWDQKKGTKWYSVYFDNEFVCRISSNTHPIQFEIDFLKGWKELFVANKIHLKLDQYKEETELVKQIKHDKKEEKQAEDKRIEKLKVDPLVRQTLKNLNQKDYQETTISEQEIESLKNETAS